MLRDADPFSFSAIYVVCGYTICAMAWIPYRPYLPLFVPNTLFLLCGRRASKIKGLLWEGDEFFLFTKRVEDGHFSWPRNSAEARNLTPEQFDWLMKDFSIDPLIKDHHPSRAS